MRPRPPTPPSPDPSSDAQRTAGLARYLAAAYAFLIVYASLHPLSGWSDSGVPILAFIDAPWPRYWTVFDLVTNVIAYLPLGFLLTLSLFGIRWRWLSVLLALLFGTALSFGLECLQNYLPTRVASNVDIGCNALGTLIGALIAARCGNRFFGRVSRWQSRLLAPYPYVDFGLVLVGLWLLTQLSPETDLFGVGDLRHLLSLLVPERIETYERYDASGFFAIEAGIVVFNTIAAGLLARTLLSRRTPPYLELGTLFLVAMAVRTLAAAILIAPGDALDWLTPGAGLGLMIGAGLLSIFLLLPAWLRNMIAAFALMAGTVLVNVTPPNPYSEIALEAWRQGHFLNFNGLTRLTATLWPFLALPYLTISARRR